WRRTDFPLAGRRGPVPGGLGRGHPRWGPALPDRPRAAGCRDPAPEQGQEGCAVRLPAPWLADGTLTPGVAPRFSTRVPLLSERPTSQGDSQLIRLCCAPPGCYSPLDPPILASCAVSAKLSPGPRHQPSPQHERGRSLRSREEAAHMLTWRRVAGRYGTVAV